MGLLIDTQSLVWISSAPEKLGRNALRAIRQATEAMFVSVVTAYEYSDLNRRGRFDADLPLDPVLSLLDATVLPFSVDIWKLADMLPDLHRDPVDRMLVAHAIYADMTLITADRVVRKYPVRTLW